jgi:predicted negative regulator of RcsB-dependent stress response
MPAYETDSEQIELFKKWWGDYGKWIIIAVVIGLAIGLGWRYWQQQHLVQRQHASLLYQQLLTADNQNNAETVMQMSAELIQRYPRLEYAALAGLLAAKAAVTQDKPTVAIEKLQWVRAHSGNASLRQIARLREARLLLAQHQIPQAQKLLTTVDDPIYQPAIDEVQGDIQWALNDRAKARQLYQSAQAGFSAILGEDKLLLMQLAQP